MKQFWNEVQPIDSFYVKMNGLLSHHDQKVVTFLYQPLIGTVCTSFYITLVNQVQEGRVWSEEWNHYQLMNLFDVNLEEIYHSRLKLEGIGLLKTYIKNTDEARTFIYELQPPLSAEQFFTDGMLNIYLYQKVGQSHFIKLKRLFTDEKINTEEFSEITRTFQDVFTTLGAVSLTNEDAQQISIPHQGQEYFHNEPARELAIDYSDFDFDLLLSTLTDVMVPRRVFTKEVKEAIGKLSFLYSINAIDMKNIVLASLTAEQDIDVEELRKAARDWYQMENYSQLPQLVDKRQPILQRENTSTPETKEEKLISYLETISPRQLLIDLSNGGEPAKTDLQTVEDIMFQQKLLPGVTNVLIHYVMLKTDMKLTKNYIEKIASHWSRKKITTVKEAMVLAKSEHRQYQEWASGKKETTPKRTKSVRTEQLPDWFVAQEDDKEQTVQTTPELEEKRRRLEEIQRKYRKNGGERDGENK